MTVLVIVSATFCPGLRDISSRIWSHSGSIAEIQGYSGKYLKCNKRIKGTLSSTSMRCHGIRALGLLGIFDYHIKNDYETLSLKHL